MQWHDEPCTWQLLFESDDSCNFPPPECLGPFGGPEIPARCPPAIGVGQLQRRRPRKIFFNVFSLCSGEDVWSGSVAPMAQLPNRPAHIFPGQRQWIWAQGLPRGPTSIMIFLGCRQNFRLCHNCVLPFQGTWPQSRDFVAAETHTKSFQSKARPMHGLLLIFQRVESRRRRCRRWLLVVLLQQAEERGVVHGWKYTSLSETHL